MVKFKEKVKEFGSVVCNMMGIGFKANVKDMVSAGMVAGTTQKPTIRVSGDLMLDMVRENLV
jgi:hypothetical protein